MRFYKPYQYIFWGGILIVVDAIPKVGILGLFLVLFGIALELIERRFGRPEEDFECLTILRL